MARKKENLFPNSKPKPQKPRAPNELFDCVCNCWGLNPKTRTQEKRVGKVVSEFKQLDATAAEVTRRWEAYRQKYPRVAETSGPEALLKHWDEFSADKRKRMPADSYPSDYRLEQDRERVIAFLVHEPQSEISKAWKQVLEEVSLGWGDVLGKQQPQDGGLLGWLIWRKLTGPDRRRR